MILFDKIIPERNNIPNPIAQITCKTINEYDGSKYQTKLFTTISKKMSHMPLMNRNLDSHVYFFLPHINMRKYQLEGQKRVRNSELLFWCKREVE